MHALSKALFFSTGAVGLLTLVFFGAVIEFNALSLKHFTQALIEFKFLDYSLPEILWLGKADSIADHLLKLKVGLGLIIGFGSLILMIISFLPNLRVQFKFLSFAISLPLLTLLFSFWIKFIHDDRTVSREEKMNLFSITLFSYPSAVFILWYGLHIKRRLPDDLNESKYASFQTKTAQVVTPTPKDTAVKLEPDSQKIENQESGNVLTTDDNSQDQLNELEEASEEVVDSESVEAEEITLTEKNNQVDESEIKSDLNPGEPEVSTSEQEQNQVENQDMTAETKDESVSLNKHDDDGGESAKTVLENSEIASEQDSNEGFGESENTP